MKQIKEINTIHDIVHNLTESIVASYTEDELRRFVYDAIYEDISFQVTEVVLGKIQANMTQRPKEPKS